MLGSAIVTFREVLEAALIIAVVLGATRAVVGRARWVGAGIGLGLVGAVLVAVLRLGSPRLSMVADRNYSTPAFSSARWRCWRGTMSGSPHTDGRSPSRCGRLGTRSRLALARWPR